MYPKKKTSWAYIGLCTLVLLLISPGVHAGNEDDGVPEEFQRLEHYRARVSCAEGTSQDLRLENQYLQLWKKTSEDGNHQAKAEVVSRAMKENDKEEPREISEIGIDQEIIVQLENDDTVQNAGDYLFNKKTDTDRPKVLLEYDAQSEQFRLIKAKGINAIHLTEDTKITVVGHGGQREGQVSVGGKTSEELAKVILKLQEPTAPIHWSSGLHNIEEISIISCDTGAGKGGEAFAKDFLLTLDKSKLSVGSLSLRTTKTIVQEDGSKLTVDFDNPEQWGKYIPDHKRKFYLGEDKNLMEVSNTKGRTAEWIENQNLDNENDPLAPRNMDNLPLYYFENKVLYHIDDEYVGQGIKDTVEGLFNTEGQPVGTESVNVYYRARLHGPIVQDRIQAQVVNGLDSLKDNIKYIIHRSNEIRRQMLIDNAALLRRYGIQIDNNMNLKETWKAILNLRNNRPVNDICRAIQRKLANTFQYFRFKDYVYSINLEDFYVNLHGRTDRHLVNQELSDFRNKDHVTYEEMKAMVNAKSFSDMAQKWVSNNQNNMGDINAYDGMAVLATHISEAVRNPNMFITNRLLWDIESAYGQFRYRNPMTRGDTWKGNHAAIGLSYETADQNMNDQVARETAAVVKAWLCRKHRKTYFEIESKNLPKAIEMPSADAKDHIRAVCDDFPVNDLNIDKNSRRRLWYHPDQLSEDSESHFEDLEERARGKSLETEFQLKMVEDRQQLMEKISDDIKKSLSKDVAKNWKIKSIENSESGTIVVLEDKMNPSEIKKIPVRDKIGSLSSEEVLHSYYKDVSGYDKVNHGLGIYGTLMGFQAANKMFAEGRKWEGGVMVAQGVHGVTEVTGINSAVNEYVGNIAQKSISQISAGLDEASAAKFTSALAEAGELAKAVPILSAGFTVFNVYEDLKQNTTIGIVDAALDSAIFITALAGPEMLPVTVALSIVRLLIDPMYNEIKHELDALPPDASVGDKFVAVLKGIGLALRDVANSFLEISEQITIPGIIYNVQNLEKEHEKSMDTIHKLQTVENYYKIYDEEEAGDKCHKKIDFTQGEESAYGGNLHVELTDRSSMIITLTDPLTSKSEVKEIPFEKDCEFVDLVTGIGETLSVKMKQKKATILWFIPVKTEDVISSMDPDDKTMYGKYVGNSKPNRFYTVQQKVIKGLSYTLDKYHYELYGKDGNDIFYIGPQKTFVEGGNGQDIYYIPSNAGQTEINNQADDKEMDLLIFNITLQQINARKENNDLKLFNNNLHEVLIINWFSGEEYRHMSFKSLEGALFKIGQVRLNGPVPLEPYSLDFSNKDSGMDVSIEDPLWDTVVSVIGSNYTDTIHGNHLNNVLQGKGSKNYLTGGDGKDMYIIQEKKDCDTINNFAKDGLIDIVELPGSYADLKVSNVPLHSVKISDSMKKSCVIIENLKKGSQWQHVVFKSKDFIVFQITNSLLPKIMPLILDYSDSLKGVNIDLNTIHGNEHIMTVIGSSHYDTIKGNNKPNFIQGGKGGGKLTGGGGSDTYVIDCKEKDFIIDNYAEDGAVDILYIKGKYSSLKFLKERSPTISITENLTIRVNDVCSIILYNWYTSESYRHLQIHTEDGITFSIPSGTTPVIFAIDDSRDTLLVNEIDTRKGIYEGATKIIGPPKYFEIRGNSKDNYIDPGTNGGTMEGGEGSDTYILRKHYKGGYGINNYAADDKVDYLILDIDFKNIQYKEDVKLQNLVITAPTVAQWICYLWFPRLKTNRHLIIKTNDLWFSFSESLEIQPLFVDERFLSTDLHLDLSSKNLQSVPIVYGSTKKRNFITGNTLNNTIMGGEDTDVLFGLGGDDVLQGSNGKDYLSGGAGDDKIHGGEGIDLILGGEGDDVIYPGQGADTIYGGSGSDTLLFFGDRGNRTGVYVNLYLGYGAGSDAEGDLYFGMDNVIGTSYDDMLIGNDDSNYIRGAGGNDLISPLGGYDFLQGGEGEDVYDLINAAGIKVIDNFASDGKADSIYIEHSEKLKITKERSEDDYHITIDHKNDEEHKIILKNWFKSEKYKHLDIKIMKWVTINGKETLQVYKEMIIE